MSADRFTRARRRDLRVYLMGRPVIFPLLTLLRRLPAIRVGSRMVINDPKLVRAILTEVPLDRTSDGTMGGSVRKHHGVGGIFDESGSEHRASKRSLARRLDSAGVAALRPAWNEAIDDVGHRIGAGETVDICRFADHLAGRTTAALLGLEGRSQEWCVELAVAARRTAALSAAQEVPSLRRGLARVRSFRDRRVSRADPALHDHLGDVLGSHAHPLSRVLALATINTTAAAIPRAVAWCSDADLWTEAADDAVRPRLVDELLRVTAPTPLLPRVAAEDARVGNRAVRRGDHLLLMVLHAVRSRERGPDPHDPMPAREANLIFGAGSRACPGARLAREQLGDVLAALAPHRPQVVRARADRHSALPSWATLTVRAGGHR